MSDLLNADAPMTAKCVICDALRERLHVGDKTAQSIMALLVRELGAEGYRIFSTEALARDLAALRREVRGPARERMERILSDLDPAWRTFA